MHPLIDLLVDKMELGFNLLSHLLCSPNVAPSDFHYFPNYEKWLGGKKFCDDEAVIVAVSSCFEDYDKTFIK